MCKLCPMPARHLQQPCERPTHYICQQSSPNGSFITQLQVDMIVCYDASASPGRNIQRMGRTGRHGNGRVVYVLAAGKETEKYNKSLSVRPQPAALLWVLL